MIKKQISIGIVTLFLLTNCNNSDQKNDESQKDKEETKTENTVEKSAEDFDYVVEEFADIQILKYRVAGFDKLSLKQKELVYYLTQAGLSGRDIIWDQNYKHNLAIRDAIEHIYEKYSGDKNNDNWNAFEVYAKRIWFSNGIHHHYSMDKLKPGFEKSYFETLVKESGAELDQNIIDIMFDNKTDMKRVNLNPNKDLVQASANNLYGEGVTEKIVDAYYAGLMSKSDETPISYGLNSKMVLENGKPKELIYSAEGLYGRAIEKIIFWLEKAVEVAENEPQKKALELLIEYYKTGDLKIWDDYNIAWVNATEGDIDYINGFIEVYGDAKGYRGTYESVVQIKDFDASDRMKMLQDNVQWFEDHSSIMDEHKKEKVTGVTYKVVNVAGEAGDASPATPIGINLPNANWIRSQHGSKSVSLGNIVEAYNNAGGSGILKEFAHDEEEFERGEAHGNLAGKLHTALHEVVGHASGKLNKGIGTPKETLKNYASTLEEARADLVALYFLLDEKMIELGLMESLEVGKAEYDSYIRNGLMTQLRRLEPGADLEEAHMRNRQLVASWVFEKGEKDNVVSKIERDGKTYFEINDYVALRALFGELLRDIQRIKSEGDYNAGRELVENYGVKVDQKIHKEVLSRSEKLNIPPYSGFINPVFEVEEDENGMVKDISTRYPKSFVEQMLDYGVIYRKLK